jgi:hypothetical protein
MIGVVHGCVDELAPGAAKLTILPPDFGSLSVGHPSLFLEIIQTFKRGAAL